MVNKDINVRTNILMICLK